MLNQITYNLKSNKIYIYICIHLHNLKSQYDYLTKKYI